MKNITIIFVVIFIVLTTICMSKRDTLILLNKKYYNVNNLGLNSLKCTIKGVVYDSLNDNSKNKSGQISDLKRDMFYNFQINNNGKLECRLIASDQTKDKFNFNHRRISETLRDAILLAMTNWHEFSMKPIFEFSNDNYTIISEDTILITNDTNPVSAKIILNDSSKIEEIRYYNKKYLYTIATDFLKKNDNYILKSIAGYKIKGKILRSIYYLYKKKSGIMLPSKFIFKELNNNMSEIHFDLFDFELNISKN